MATTRIEEFQTGFASESDADFRKFVQQVHDALEAVGLEQTADTGQINPETVELPATLDTDAGFEIWKFTDAAQAEHPVFLKIFYGVETSNAPQDFWLRLNAGEGSDGSGNLTGNAIEGAGTKVISTGFSTLGEIIVTFKDGIFVLAGTDDGDIQSETAGGDIIFGGVERIRDANGDPVAGFCVYTTASQTITLQVVAEGVVHPERKLFATVTNASSGQIGEDIVLGVFIPVGLKAHPPLLGLLATNEDDFAGNTSGQVSRFGLNRTYLKIGSKGSESTSWSDQGQANIGIMALAE